MRPARLKVDGIEDLLRATGGDREFRPVQMGSRPVRGELAVAKASEATFTYGWFHSDIHVSGTWSNGRATIGIVLAAEGVSLFGKRAAQGDIVVAGKGRDIDARYRESIEYIAVNVDKSDVLATAEGCGRRIDAGILNGSDLLRLDDARQARLVERMRCVALGLRTGALTAVGPDAERALRDDLLLEFTRGLSQAHTDRGERSESRHTRPKLVQQAEEWLALDPHRPQGVQQIAHHFGVSTRHLYRAFRAEVGMSPARYLKRYRMTQARLDLLGADPAETTVTDVAVSWGFWELGRFAVEYRHLFGEMPSQTLRTYAKAHPVPPYSVRRTRGERARVVRPGPHGAHP